MTYRRRGRGRRPAFTLIELLVVMAIIAILVSLTAVGVMSALVVGPRATTRTEISEFETKLGQARGELNNIPILPSHLRLREDNNYVAPPGPQQAQLQADYNQTKAVLQGAFGRHVTDPTVNGQPNQIDWNGNGSIDAGDLVLEGEQCLVFWLGGIPQYSGTTITMTGFCTSNQANPAALGGSRTRPFEFKNARLKTFTAPGSVAAFPVYIDPWKNGSATVWTSATGSTVGMPYAFFASYNTEVGAYRADCPSLNVSPYYLIPPPTPPATSPPVAWVSPGTFQIISAGRDGVFGPGGLWNPANGLSSPAAVKDDQANFSRLPLDSAAN